MAQPFNPSVPIYLQLCERIKNRIIRGEIGIGERLPSVRELAIDAAVNPNTVQRAYRELEETGIVEKKRGQGTFVTEKPAVLQRMREELKTSHIKLFVSEMREMGYSEREMLDGLKDFLTDKEEKE
ncbi:GntR family transcriptional regulator [Sporolactobacillus terrae]|uniref:GntR family transcriptional regulator n=1 Tax=Sporolactobacillus terrae TaxID=269673 RepID=A0A410DCE4_9BACL|nr:GntR family transcriptional regulator [Sporolactobacillus terrae]QAA23703.1 GntR family transcriptional regulator [Sporolactobacillus terrae]QAA26674.1 GntR family transcriptional regulator [Sporolactobacillus terrae]UAK15742.1 GntR family transcriptional regulator [Sporolactobacillus terrae]BBO00230.1 putative HTH-type transcriptional regulator YhcF [Sporolactobacillus terrae]